MVGSIADPDADDAFGSTGPGAPGGFKGGEHPVKARLLARARVAQAGLDPDEQQSVSNSDAPRATTEAAVTESSTDEGATGEGATGEMATGPGAHINGTDRDTTGSGLGGTGADAVGSRAAGDFEAADSSAAPQQRSTPPSSIPPVSPDSGPTRAETAIPHQRYGAPASGFGGSPAESERDPMPTPPPGAVASELEKIARRSSSQGGPPSTKLSPNLVALLGALLGLTVIGTVGVFLGQFEPDRVTVAQPTEPEDEPVSRVEEKKPEQPKREKIEGPWRIMDTQNEPGKKVIGGKIGKQAFLRAIQDAGLPKTQAYRAYTALKDELDLDHCRSSDEFLALIESGSKKLLAFEYIRSKEEVYQAKTGDDGLLTGKRLDLKVDRNQVRRAMIHDGKSFEESARASGWDPGLSDVIEDAFRGHLLMSELEAGDRLRIIAQEVTVLGEFARYAGIEAVEVHREGKKPQRIYYYPHPVEGGYFDGNGRAPYEGGWRKPIPEAPVTSKFNMKRMHPVLNRVMPHTGTDFGAPAGTPIGATSPGTVSFKAYAGASGNLVKIKHHDGYESGYAHLSRFGNINVGDKVDRLQTIGYCGSTGRSTGPHLHFTMKKDGKFIDPESLNLDGMRVLPPSHRPEFAEVRKKYDPLLDQIPLPKAAPRPAAEPAPADPEEPDGDANPMMAEEPASEPAPAAPTPKPTPAAEASGPPAKATKPSAIFMTDQELLEMQARTDDGEVPP